MDSQLVLGRPSLPGPLACRPTPAAASRARRRRTCPTADRSAASRRDQPPARRRTGQTGYLGVARRSATTRAGSSSRRSQPDSPAAKAGLKKGDVVTRVGDQPVRTPDAFREWLQAHGPGETVKLGLRPRRQAGRRDRHARRHQPADEARPGRRPSLGVPLGRRRRRAKGVRVEPVAAGSPAAKAGLKVGDRVVKLDGKDFAARGRLTDMLAEKKPGDMLTFVVRRDGKDVELKATLTRPPGGAAAAGGGRRPAATPGRASGRRTSSASAVVAIEFPDVKHNAKITPQEWEKALFSQGDAYKDKSATGQPVHGSLNDYFREQSDGGVPRRGQGLRLGRGRQEARRLRPGSGTSNKTALLAEALDKLTARDGKDALDGLRRPLFVYAGEPVGPTAGRSTTRTPASSRTRASAAATSSAPRAARR